MTSCPEGAPMPQLNPVYQPFSAQTTRHGATTDLILAGELDLLTAPVAIEELERALTPTPDLLLIDLTQLTYLASTGLATLLTGQRRAHATDTDLRMFGARHT